MSLLHSLRGTNLLFPLNSTHPLSFFKDMKQELQKAMYHTLRNVDCVTTLSIWLIITLGRKPKRKSSWITSFKRTPATPNSRGNTFERKWILIFEIWHGWNRQLVVNEHNLHVVRVDEEFLFMTFYAVFICSNSSRLKRQRVLVNLTMYDTILRCWKNIYLIIRICV